MFAQTPRRCQIALFSLIAFSAQHLQTCLADKVASSVRLLTVFLVMLKLVADTHCLRASQIGEEREG